MSAEVKEWEKQTEVTFTTEDEDFNIKAKDTVVDSNQDLIDVVKQAQNVLYSYVGDLSYVEKTGAAVYVTAYGYKANGSVVALFDGTWNELGNKGLGVCYGDDGKAVYEEIEFVLSFLIDEYSDGDKIVEGKYSHDTIDDRDQKLVTISVEAWNDRTHSGSGKFTKEQYLASDDKVLTNVIKGVAGYGDREYVGTGKDRVAYRLVFNVKGDEVVATWEKDPAELIVWGEVKEEPKYDELDANKDGVVSCEEALGKGWVWNNETSACELKGSSNTGSYVPNTATK